MSYPPTLPLMQLVEYDGKSANFRSLNNGDASKKRKEIRGRERRRCGYWLCRDHTINLANGMFASPSINHEAKGP
jgi:hypothetical protein